MIYGVILQKLQALDEVLNELKSLGGVDAGQLRQTWQTRRAIERDLQVLVEIVIDVCQRLISLRGQAPATTGLKAIERCIQLGILSSDENYRLMVQFRNFIVHRYEHIDIDVLVDMVNNHLVDFEGFREEILAYVRG